MGRQSFAGFHPLAGQIGTVWTAETGGQRITDLLDEDGNAITHVVSANVPHGLVEFDGPPDDTSTVWVDFGGGQRTAFAVEDLSGPYTTVVRHGATAGTARPTTGGSVLWIGTVQPTNADAAKDVVVVTGLTRFATVTRTAGSIGITTTSPSWQTMDASLALTLDVSAGDVIAFSINGKWPGGEAVGGRLGWYSVNRAADLVAADAGGIVGWQGPPSEESTIGGLFFYTVQAGDIASGSATFQLRGSRGSAAATRTLKGDAFDPLRIAAFVL